MVGTSTNVVTSAGYRLDDITVLRIWGEHDKDWDGITDEFLRMPIIYRDITLRLV